MRARFVQKPLAPGQGTAVVAVVEDNGLFVQPVRFELRNDLTDLLVHLHHPVVVLCPVPADCIGIRMVGWERDLARVVHQWLFSVMDLAFVAYADVVDMEKGLTLPTISIMS